MNAYFDKEQDKWIIGERDPEKRLTEAQRNIYLLYQWGCWVTSLARLRLMEGVADFTLDAQGDALLCVTQEGVVFGLLVKGQSFERDHSFSPFVL